MKHDFKLDFDNEKDEVRASCCGGDWTCVVRGPNQARVLFDAMEDHKRPWVRIGCLPVYAQQGGHT